VINLVRDASAKKLILTTVVTNEFATVTITASCSTTEAEFISTQGQQIRVMITILYQRSDFHSFLKKTVSLFPLVGKGYIKILPPISHF